MTKKQEMMEEIAERELCINRLTMSRILADKSNPKHMKELKKLAQNATWHLTTDSLGRKWLVLY